ATASVSLREARFFAMVNLLKIERPACAGLYSIGLFALRVDAGFGCRIDIFSLRSLEDILRYFHLIRIVGMDGNQRASASDLSVIPLCLVFRNSHTHERTDDATGSLSDSGAAQRCHDGA